jgi:GPI-anchor transamidase subunit T
LPPKLKLSLFCASHSVDNTWKEFTHALSGLFCASLTYMYSPYQNSPNMTRPVVPFRPQTHTYPSIKAFPPTLAAEMASLPMRHGMLQGESICTENLTPWSKQLPCRVQSGLGKLLAKVPPLLDSHYSSVALHFRPIALGSKYELIATLTLVSPADESRKFSLTKMFPSAESLSACPLASSSKLIIREDASTHSIESSEPLERSGSYATLDLKKMAASGSKGAIVSVKFTQSDPLVKLKSVEWLDVRRWTAGWGLQRGQLAILISNKLNSTIDATLHQVVPWLMRLYFHSIRFTRDGKLLSQEEGATHFFRFLETSPDLRCHFLFSESNRTSRCLAIPGPRPTFSFGG